MEVTPECFYGGGEESVGIRKISIHLQIAIRSIRPSGIVSDFSELCEKCDSIPLSRAIMRGKIRCTFCG